MESKTFYIIRQNGNIKVTFERLWDGQDKYFNENDIEELTWDLTVNDQGRFEKTLSGFEMISKVQYEDTYKLCGYMYASNLYYLSTFINFGLAYYDENNHAVQFGGPFAFNGTYQNQNHTTVYDGLTILTGVTISLPWNNLSMYGGPKQEGKFNFNFPIFKSEEAMSNYVRYGIVEDCWNLDDDYDLNETNYYYIYNKQQEGTLFNGTITPTSSDFTWHSLKFSANKAPVLYFDDNFELKLSAPLVVASKAVTGPGYLIDNIPETGWTEKTLEYSGPFYGTIAGKINYTGELPANGTYMYGAEVNTNIYIFKTKAEADNAIETGDYSAAANAYDINYGNTHQPIEIGDAEAATTFGSGYATSPFVSSYICTRNQVLNVANAFYTNDPTLLDNIKKGLELFGANPFEAICGLTWFPFDLTTVATAAPQNYVYFGSFQYTGITGINKITALNASGYINAGSFYLKPLFNSYRDFEPYCQLSVYLPYSGWHEIDIAKYYKKTVNVRYYVDIYTNTFACALVADNQIIDIFNGNIGVTLPICGSNLSEYANSMLRSVLGTVGGTAGGALSGAMLGGGVPGAVIGATVGGFAGLAKGTFEMSQKGTPKDHLQVKGAFSGASSSYMPQYVIFRYDVHDLIVPQNLTELYGKPSSAGGKIGSFSGFLKCDTIKLNTGRMTDAEINETLSLLRQGIFV